MQQISTERLLDQARLCGQSDPLGIVQGVEAWPYEQMVYAQPRICSREWDAQTPLRFWDINGSSYPSQTTRSYDNQQKKKENLQNCGLCCPGGPQSEIERMWKEDKYLDLW